MSVKNKASKTGGEEAWKRYVNLLECLRQLTLKPGSPQLEVEEQVIFNELAVLWSLGKPVTVLQAMKMPVGMSPTTIHRKLKGLRKKGVIALEEQEADNRIKHVVPTDLAQSFLVDLNRCVLSATR